MARRKTYYGRSYGPKGLFVWDTASFFLGVVSLVDLSTATRSYQLWHRNPSARYHLALSIIAICHLCDFFLRTFTFTEDQGEKTTDGQLILTIQSMLVCDASIVFAAIGGAGLQAINISRLRAAGKKYMPRATRILTVLSIVSMGVCVVNNVYYIYAYFDAYLHRDYHLVNVGDLIFSSWSIFDGLVNGSISGTFVLILQQIGGGHTSQSSKITKRFQRLLVQVAINLTMESLFIIASNVLIQTEPTFDPYWCSVYFSESARMLLFTDFLHKLHWLLTATPAPDSVKDKYQGGGAVGIIDSFHATNHHLSGHWRGGADTFQVMSVTATMIQAQASQHPFPPRSLATAIVTSEQSISSGVLSTTGLPASLAARLLQPRPTSTQLPTTVSASVDGSVEGQWSQSGVVSHNAVRPSGAVAATVLEIKERE